MSRTKPGSVSRIGDYRTDIRPAPGHNASGSVTAYILAIREEAARFSHLPYCHRIDREQRKTDESRHAECSGEYLSVFDHDSPTPKSSLTIETVPTDTDLRGLVHSTLSDTPRKGFSRLCLDPSSWTSWQSRPPLLLNPVDLSRVYTLTEREEAGGKQTLGCREGGTPATLGQPISSGLVSRPTGSLGTATGVSAVRRTKRNTILNYRPYEREEVPSPHGVTATASCRQTELRAGALSAGILKAGSYKGESTTVMDEASRGWAETNALVSEL